MLEVWAGIALMVWIAVGVYAIRFLLEAGKRMKQAVRALERLEAKAEQVSREACVLMKHTDELAVELSQQIKSAGGFFRSLSEAGRAVDQAASEMKRVSGEASQRLAVLLRSLLLDRQDTPSPLDAFQSAWKWWRAGRTSRRTNDPQAHRERNTPKGEDQHGR